MTDRLHWWSFNCNLGCSDQSMLIWDSHVFFQSWSPSTSSWWRCGSWSSPGPGQSSSSWGTSSPSSSTSQHTGKCFSWENFLSTFVSTIVFVWKFIIPSPNKGRLKNFPPYKFPDSQLCLPVSLSAAANKVKRGKISHWNLIEIRSKFIRRKLKQK